MLGVTTAAAHAAGDAAETRPARRPEQPQSKRARTRAIVLDEDEDEEPVVVALAPPLAEPAPVDADEAAWVRALAAVLQRRFSPTRPLCCLYAACQLLPPPASARTAVVLSEEEQKLLRHAHAAATCGSSADATPLLCRRTQQTLEELQRPVYEEPEKPAQQQQPEPAPAPAVKLAIFLRDVSGDKQKFIIKSDTKFEAVFDSYCAARTLKPDSVSFFFDGDVVSPNATPAALDMDDEDCVDVKRV